MSVNTSSTNSAPHQFKFSIGLKGTIEQDSHTITVLAYSYAQCWKKIKRYLDDEYETKGRELKAIVHHTTPEDHNRTDFEFCGRTITLYQI